MAAQADHFQATTQALLKALAAQLEAAPSAPDSGPGYQLLGKSRHFEAFSTCSELSAIITIANEFRSL